MSETFLQDGLDFESLPKWSVESLDTGRDLGCRGGGEYVAGHRDVEHALADKARMRRLVAGAPS